MSSTAIRLILLITYPAILLGYLFFISGPLAAGAPGAGASTVFVIVLVSAALLLLWSRVGTQDASRWGWLVSGLWMGFTIGIYAYYAVNTATALWFRLSG